MAAPSARSEVDGDRSEDRAGLVYRELLIAFVLLVSCFAAWGAAAQLTDVLVGVFRKVFQMSNFQSALVQLAYYGAYFSLAVPAAVVNRRFGYKTGVVTGLALATVGGLLFYPAAQTLAYVPFLLALFVLAGGLSILETSANPFVIAMGPERRATQRLNLAQAFNPIGSNVGVLLGALVVLPRITPSQQRSSLSGAALAQSQDHDLSVVLVPYLGIAAVLAVIGLLIALRKMPTPAEEQQGDVAPGVLGRLWRNRHYRYGVGAQFANIGAQTCTWTFVIQYAQDVVGVPEAQAGWYLQGSLVAFLVFRFLMTYLLGLFRPTKLLLVMACVGVGLALVAALSPNLVGLLAAAGISAALSLMFPTIYGVALDGLGEDTKFGAAGLVMAILGGATVPLLQGGVMDVASTALGFLVTAVCLVLVGCYALFDLRHPRDTQAPAAAADVDADDGPGVRP